jgi:hypothetical protein
MTYGGQVSENELFAITDRPRVSQTTQAPPPPPSTRMNTIDFTNTEQVKAAIMQHLPHSSTPLDDRLPAFSTAMSIAHRVEFQKCAARHTHIQVITQCLRELAAENRIMAGHGLRNTIFAPLPTTDRDRERWAFFNAAVAARAAREQQAEEPAADSDDE